MVKLFNFWYLFFIVLGAGIIVGLYYMLRNKKYITKKHKNQENLLLLEENLKYPLTYG